MIAKTAVYIDEAGDDPVLACQTIAKYNIFNVAIRYIWSNPIDQLSDQSSKKLLDILNSNNLSTILIASDLGKCDASYLNTIDDAAIKRVFDLSVYFKTNMIRIYIGLNSKVNCVSKINDWMAKISELSLKYNVIPILEITNDCYLKPEDVVLTLLKHRRWKILYDPVQFIIHKNIDVFVKYWSLLKKHINVIDVRDFKIGHGFKPPGFGDAKLQLTFEDAALSEFKGWYVLEPSLGRRHGSGVGKHETLKMAIDAYTNLF